LVAAGWWRRTRERLVMMVMQVLLLFAAAVAPGAVAASLPSSPCCTGPQVAEVVEQMQEQARLGVGYRRQRSARDILAHVRGPCPPACLPPACLPGVRRPPAQPNQRSLSWALLALHAPTHPPSTR
jgi:hypothetical protein